MSILKTPKERLKLQAAKAAKLAAKGEAAAKKAPPRASAKSYNGTPNAAARPSSSSAKDLDPQRGPEDATAKLKRSFDNLAADKRDNSYGYQNGLLREPETDMDSSAVIVGGLPSSKGAKYGRLLDTHGAPSPRSLPPSPALSGIGSPSLLPSGNTTQDRAKQQRFPLMHELAVQDLSRQDLLERWDGGTEEEFDLALDKVASFDKDLNKWVLRKNCWKDLDIFEYHYSDDGRRQKAITNAIKWFDRNRVSASDPLWQKLLPKADRGKGICLSNLQVTLAKGPVVPAPKQRTDTASASGGDSEKDDSATSTTKRAKGGEPMSRSNSQTSTGKKKLSASEAQAKRLLSTTKKKPLPAATTKAAPKPAAPKPAAKAAAPAKAGRFLSKEFVSDSSSSDDEVPLSTSKGKPKAAGAPAPKPTQRAAEKPRATEKAGEKTKETAAPKPKPAAVAKASPREQNNDKEKDTIRAQVIAKPIRPAAKRPRDADDDDSSSSGTPLSKRVKPAAKPLPAPIASAKGRTASDASQNGRGAGGGVGVAVPKAKNTSPVKSSPLASSPPTNASDMEQDRAALSRARERERERERRRETAVRSSSSSNTDSSVNVSMAKKRPPTDALAGNNSKAKRQRPSQETIEMATRFRQFYARYEQLHYDIASHDNPDPSRVTDLIDMRDRLSRMKNEIYAAVEV
jgi:RNA polymerase II elongation factor ELL